MRFLKESLYANKLHWSQILLCQKKNSDMRKSIGLNLDKNGHLEIIIRVEDFKSNQYIDFNFKHTQHSFIRASQRGINSSKINAALQYGESVYKQGLIYFILGEHNIPDSLIKEKEKLKNTVVVVSGDSNEVITCYRSPNPFKNIKLKSKRLSPRFSAAA